MKECLYLQVLAARKAGLLTMRIDPPKPIATASDPLEHFRAPFENAGALVAAPGGEVSEGWRGFGRVPVFIYLFIYLFFLGGGRKESKTRSHAPPTMPPFLFPPSSSSPRSAS